MSRRRETAISCREEAFVCVSLPALPGDRSSSGTELRVSKDRLSSLVSVTSYCLGFYSAFSLGIPRSFDAHLIVRRALSIWCFTFLHLLFYIYKASLHESILSCQDNYHQRYSLGNLSIFNV